MDSVDGDQDTILVGLPKHVNGKGAVFLFQRAHDPKNSNVDRIVLSPSVMSVVALAFGWAWIGGDETKS